MTVRFLFTIVSEAGLGSKVRVTKMSSDIAKKWATHIMDHWLCSESVATAKAIDAAIAEDRAERAALYDEYNEGMIADLRAERDSLAAQNSELRQRGTKREGLEAAATWHDEQAHRIARRRESVVVNNHENYAAAIRAFIDKEPDLRAIDADLSSDEGCAEADGIEAYTVERMKRLRACIDQTTADGLEKASVSLGEPPPPDDEHGET